MRALIQRVSSASVRVDEQLTGRIGPGLLVFFGAGKGDGLEDVAWLVRKTANLRIFEDEAGKLNLNVRQAGGAVLAVSQFTLYADCRRGNRPGFDQAAPPEQARDLYEQFVAALRREGLTVETGVFQAHMAVELINDGPVTIMLESPAHQ
ncbi:MAG: D-tyrosyl-tRNA(Tyr) deacylase [Firmicutes bacterium]|nr:D-tyrosyl-tRNA(Tyr) deacylase [Bacillota bacterium]